MEEANRGTEKSARKERETDMEREILEMLAELCEDDIVKDDRDVELFETGLIDSLVFAELLVEIEERFGVVIAPSEVERKDINTPGKVIELIRKGAVG